MVVKQTIELLHLFAAVGGSGQRDSPVRMQMVDVRERQKAMKRRVNRGSDSALAERAERIHLHHLVFIFRATIDALQPVQLFGVERC